MIKAEKKYSSYITVEQTSVISQYLEREVLINVYYPAAVQRTSQLSLLLINDGQDLVKMGFDKLLNEFVKNNELSPLMVVGIHCGEDRKNEYGVAFSPDYEGRGAKAGLYTKFVMEELLPFIRKNYNIKSFKDKSFAGFSLGGLSALDIVWNNAMGFSRVGVFSGSLWWRRKSYDDGYDDEKDKLMHLQVRLGNYYSWLKFYIQCGTLDEVADRNNNGIIDAIDDAWHLINELKEKGYSDEDIEFVIVEDGEHTIETWKDTLPGFLRWGWGVK
jgi:enterochelin esterase-like enzyme